MLFRVHGLCLFYVYAEWKPWGIPNHYESEIIENDAPVLKRVPLHHPCLLPEEFYKTIEAVTTGTIKDAKKT